ncbi:uncharacterized protein PgNI_02955 [Pyricularia grisea]|uniref:Uncharacterized protein n=1 Tax=Pyricularia grisea TaxID=148305 RepID=A0A6P8BDM5_PYRGI|nr:uncharacterized protein PgNI_02955 [Pyricularia grisea]TLD13935.1 hypothetical protein PgNI_02955 [Pyricularia grisea]
MKTSSIPALIGSVAVKWTIECSDRQYIVMIQAKEGCGYALDRDLPAGVQIGGIPEADWEKKKKKKMKIMPI